MLVAEWQVGSVRVIAGQSGAGPYLGTKAHPRLRCPKNLSPVPLTGRIMLASSLNEGASPEAF
jgi:hypothetical protein